MVPLTLSGLKRLVFSEPVLRRPTQGSNCHDGRMNGSKAQDDLPQPDLDVICMASESILLATKKASLLFTAIPGCIYVSNQPGMIIQLPRTCSICFTSFVTDSGGPITAFRNRNHWGSTPASQIITRVCKYAIAVRRRDWLFIHKKLPSKFVTGEAPMVCLPSGLARRGVEQH
jgi:hypothetical protein